MTRGWRWPLAGLGLLGAVSPQPQVFAPSVLSTAKYESHPAFSPDGKILLLVHSDANFGNWRIMESRRAGKRWTTPRLAEFAGDVLAADPYFAPGGRHVYFIAARPVPGEIKPSLDIWRVERSRGGWAEPERLPPPINSSAPEWFPRPQRDGTIYFGSGRPGGLGATDIYRAVPTGAGWRVDNLGAPINSPGDEYELEVAPGGRSAILMAARSPDGNGNLYLVRRRGAGWSAPQDLGPAVNTPELEVGPLFSRDGAWLYFSSRRNTAKLGDILRIRSSEIGVMRRAP